jgi:hypothetical protein
MLSGTAAPIRASEVRDLKKGKCGTWTCSSGGKHIRTMSATFLSHPEPTESLVVTNGFACIDLTQMQWSPSGSLPVACSWLHLLSHASSNSPTIRLCMMISVGGRYMRLLWYCRSATESQKDGMSDANIQRMITLLACIHWRC